MLTLTGEVYADIIAQSLDEAPLECCGLLAGNLDTGAVSRYFRCVNAAQSARVYTVAPRDQLRATRTAEDAGLDIIGVVHSHTHTPAHPSATDIAQAPDPDWHYVIVSLADAEPSLRSFRIRAGVAEEEPVVLG
ncbi:MAG: Mov34/MPN/PAD-1 family protein [Acidimicrobiales bacterium]